MEEEKNPSKFVPTKKMIYAFLAIFIVFSFFNLSNFPLSKFLSMGSLEDGINFGVGWPKVFVSLDLLNATTTSVNWLNLILDSSLILIISYILDVLLNFFFELRFVKEITSKLLGKEKEVKSERPELIA